MEFCCPFLLVGVALSRLRVAASGKGAGSKIQTLFSFAMFVLTCGTGCSRGTVDDRSYISVLKVPSRNFVCFICVEQGMFLDPNRPSS